MTEKEQTLIKIVNDYEDGKLTLDEAISQFNEHSNQDIDQYILDNYWASEGLEEFVARHAMEEIADWKEIDDDRARVLIEEASEITVNPSIEGRNLRALEKRYGKPSGVLFGMIDDCDTEEILAFLKKDSKIRL